MCKLHNTHNLTHIIKKNIENKSNNQVYIIGQDTTALSMAETLFTLILGPFRERGAKYYHWVAFKAINELSLLSNEHLLRSHSTL